MNLPRILAKIRLRTSFLRFRKAVGRRLRRSLERIGVDRLSRPALYDMDRALDEKLNIRGGYFVEAGANDGYTQSNTYWLERFRGWRGLLVEPMPNLAREARIARPKAIVVEAALVSAEFDSPTVRMNFGDLMSTVDGAMPAGADASEWAERGLAPGWRDGYQAEVPARTLSDVLDEVAAPEVDLLSLDVEGYESSVLRGLDLARHAPRFILVEMQNIPEARPEIEAILGTRYLLDAQLSPFDLLYRRAN